MKQTKKSEIIVRISNIFRNFAVEIRILYLKLFIMDISVLVPLYNEAESLPSLHEWIVRVMKAHSFTYEIVFVNDGSTDDTEKIIKSYKENGVISD